MTIGPASQGEARAAPSGPRPARRDAAPSCRPPRVELAAPGVEIKPGATVELKGKIVRKGTFDGPVTVKINGLPAGLKAEPVDRRRRLPSTSSSRSSPTPRPPRPRPEPRSPWRSRSRRRITRFRPTPLAVKVLPLEVESRTDGDHGSHWERCPMSRPLARADCDPPGSRVFAIVLVVAARSADDPKSQAEKKARRGPRRPARRRRRRRGDAERQAAAAAEATRPRRPRPSHGAGASEAGRRRPGEARQLHAGRRADPGRELHRLPQPAQVGEQVRDDDLRPARQGGPAGRGHHARAGQARREQPGRADPARRPAADAVQAGPAPRRRRSRSSSAGSRRGPSTTATRPARTGRSSCARRSRSRSPRPIPSTVPITALEFSRDGSAIAASGYHEITFWKTADGTLDRRLTGLAERIYDIAYSPDGKWMATASGDPGVFGVAKLWLAEPGGGGKPVRDLVETQDVVFSVAFSPDSKKIATAGADRTIRIFEVETGKLLTQIEDHADWIFAVAFSPDGKRLASASRDKTVQGLRRREERVARHLPRPRPAGLHRLVHARRQERSRPAAKTTGSGSGTPTTTARRSARSAASAARSSSSGIRPTARPCSPAAPTRRSTSSTPTGRRCASLQGHNDWIYSAGDLARRQDRRLGELGRRGPALEPRRRQADPQLHRRAGLQARGDHEGRSPLILGGSTLNVERKRVQKIGLTTKYTKYTKE